MSGTDIRGDEAFLTDDFAARFGYAFALWLAKKLDITPDALTIAVGRDPRASGQRLEAALVKGITAADSDVLRCDLTTTPAITMTLYARERTADGAIMVTAGNCASGMNGFKMMSRASSVSADDVNGMIDAAMGLRVPERLVTKAEPVADYMERLARMARERLEDDAVKPLLGLRVVVDASGGAGGFYARFLEDLGAETEGSLNLEPDGSFSGHAPDPTDPKAIEPLSRSVLEK